MLLRTWLLMALLLQVSACGKNGNISFVGVDKLDKEARELFDIKVKVKFSKDTKNNSYYLYLSYVKVTDQNFGGTVASKAVDNDGIVEFSGIYFDKECSSNCLLVAEVLVKTQRLHPSLGQMVAVVLVHIVLQLKPVFP